MIVFAFTQPNSTLHRYLQKPGVVVWTSLEEAVGYGTHDSPLRALERVGAIVIDISEPSNEVFYIIAQAMIVQKPTLCVYPKNKQPRDLLIHLADKHVPASIQTKSYTDATLAGLIDNFLYAIDDSLRKKETPTIKFTLRLTPFLERYLDWLLRRKQINKAEYIRDLIRADLLNNEDYLDETTVDSTLDS